MPAEPIIPEVEEERRFSGEAGYVMALGALLILPLFVAVGFAVDVGSWYARASELQRAADAASLAAVVHLPNEVNAEAAARATLARNGFPDADADGTVDGTDTRIVFTVVEGNRFRVRLVDRDVDLFFTSVLMDSMEIRRQAISEYVLPLSMGSPRNFLGTGADPASMLPSSGVLDENFWLAISGPCASREQGDLLSAQTDANYTWTGSGGPSQNPGTMQNPVPTQPNRCTGSDDEGTTVPNPNYDDEGYFYAVEVPASMDGQSLEIDIYDGSMCDTSLLSGANDPGDDNNTGGNFSTVYRVRGTDSNPYDPTDNPLIATTTVTADDTNYCGSSLTDWQDKWVNLQTVAGADAGIYFVQVTTTGGVTDTAFHGKNSFSLRAHFGSTFSPCSSDETDATYFDEDCPQVYAIDNLGVFANLAGFTPSFYLTSVGDEHSGKVLQIELFDPGEGATALEILDPLGRSVDFEWTVLDGLSGDAAPTGGWAGTVDQPGTGPCTVPASCAKLDLIGNANTFCTTSESCYYRGFNMQVGSFRGSRSKYSDRSVHIEVQLPDDIATEYSGATWWRIRYSLNASGVTDRTTWSVRVVGDPVRLVE